MSSTLSTHNINKKPQPKTTVSKTVLTGALAVAIAASLW